MKTIRELRTWRHKVAAYNKVLINELPKIEAAWAALYDLNSSTAVRIRAELEAEFHRVAEAWASLERFSVRRGRPRRMPVLGPPKRKYRSRKPRVEVAAS